MYVVIKVPALIFALIRQHAFTEFPALRLVSFLCFLRLVYVFPFIPESSVFGPPGSQSFHQQARIVKNLDLYCLVTFYDFICENDVNLPSKSNKQKTSKNNKFLWHPEGNCVKSRIRSRIASQRYGSKDPEHCQKARLMIGISFMRIRIWISESGVNCSEFLILQKNNVKSSLIFV
jgi:hypothetical protein